MNEKKLERLTLLGVGILIVVIFLPFKQMELLPSSHGWVTSEQLAMIFRATLENGFVGYRNIFSGPVELSYFPKVPFVSYALLNIFFLPVVGLWNKLLLGKILMDVVLVLTIYLTYRLLNLQGRDWKSALLATLLGYSGYIITHYREMIAPEFFTLLSYILTGFAIDSVERKKKVSQGLLLSALSVSIGHVVINTFPFLVWGAFSIFRYLRRRSEENLAVLKHTALVSLLAVSLSGGYLVYNVYQESRLRGVPIQETDIFTSGKRRLDIKSDYQETYGEHLNWSKYIPMQGYRLAISIWPNSLQKKAYVFILLGLGSIFFFRRYRREPWVWPKPQISLLAPFWIPALAGLFPFFFLRGYALPHDFSAIPYTLAATGVWFLFFQWVNVKRFTPVLIIVLVLFVSSYAKGHRKKLQIAGERDQILLEFDDFDRLIPHPAKIYFLEGSQNVIPELNKVTGFLVYRDFVERDLSAADFVVSRKKELTGYEPLTPGHRTFFLYKRR